MENRTKKVEQLLMWSKVLDKHESEFNIKMYNRALNALKFEKEFINVSNEIAQAMDIINFISRAKKLSKDFFENRTVNRSNTIWRQTAMTLVRCNTKLSLTQIGNLFGGRDHATVLHSHKTVDAIFDTNNAFKIELNEILRIKGLIYYHYKRSKY